MSKTIVPKYIFDAIEKYESFRLAVTYNPSIVDRLTPENISSEIALNEARFEKLGRSKFIELMKSKAEAGSYQSEEGAIQALANAEMSVQTNLKGGNASSANQRASSKREESDPAVDAWTSIFGG